MAFFGGNGGDGEEADCADVIICDFKGLFCFTIEFEKKKKQILNLG